MAGKGLWIKEIQAGKFKFLIGLLVFGVVGVFIPLTYGTIARLMDTVPIPAQFVEQAKLLKDYGFYIWSQWFGKNLYQFATIMAVIFGSGIISTEVSKKTIQFLLAKPIRRQEVFMIKYVVNYSALALVVIISTLALYIAVITTGHSFPFTVIMQNTVMALAGSSVIFSTSVYFSTVFDQTLRSVLVSLAVALMFSIPGLFSVVRDFSIYYHMSGYEIFIGKGFPFIPVIVMIIVSGVLYQMANRRFSRRDF